MMMHRGMVRFGGPAALLVLAITAAGCESLRRDAGFGKQPPDEFAVVTKAPLTIPPDFALRPPRPGERQANSGNSAERARAALYSGNVRQLADQMGPEFSEGEKLLLAYSGGASADPSIRAALASESAILDGGPTLTESILFWRESQTKGTPVDAQAEANRIRGAQAAGQNPGTAPTPGN